MKKSIYFATVSMLLLCACSSTMNTAADTTSRESQQTISTVSTEKQSAVISAEEKITGQSCEITVHGVTLSYDVLPDYKSSVYQHYVADSGKVYIDIDVDVKNIQKQALSCDEIMNIIADYNNGYTYNAFPIVEDSTTGFTYANITQIDPLETMAMRYLVECPQEVEETQNPLFLTFKVDNEKYNYIIRNNASTTTAAETQVTTAPTTTAANAAPVTTAFIPETTIFQTTITAASQKVPESSTGVYFNDISPDTSTVDRFAFKDVEISTNTTAINDLDGIN